MGENTALMILCEKLSMSGQGRAKTAEIDI